MSKVVGPVLATGAITMANQSIFHGKPVDWRVPVATGLAAITLSMIERAWPKGAQMMAWTMLIVVITTRVNPGEESPAETIQMWWSKNTPKYTPPKNG
ncbi:hypothetical protein AB0D63_43315 [Kitasatospora sp. NPDC048343]|uniref:hypothetical protein n=1 Tax=Kitasatospora sp. NPDC048343 TaxID=3154717 RepID=UPI0033C8836B